MVLASTCLHSTTARQGETGCKGRTVPMEKLDGMVAVEVDAKEVRIMGSKSVLLRTLVAA